MWLYCVLIERMPRVDIFIVLIFLLILKILDIETGNFLLARILLSFLRIKFHGLNSMLL